MLVFVERPSPSGLEAHPHPSYVLRRQQKEKRKMVLGISRNAIATVLGFFAGVLVNQYVERKMPTFPGYGIVLIEPVRWDDVVLIGAGVALMLVQRFGKLPKGVFYFGLGFMSGVVIDEIVEAIWEMPE